jgi:ribosome modulation factor
MTSHDKKMRAFNMGSDARLAGKSMDRNPYVERSHSWKYWNMGWRDVNKNWGAWAKWPVKNLPEVEE